MITYVFGSPGVGKSCYAQREVIKNRSKYKYIFSNEPFDGAYLYDYKDFGYRSFPRGSLIIIDEAGIYANNRAFTSMPKAVIKYLKRHRHYDVDILVISQSFEDVDITIRRLVNRYLYIKKLPIFTLVRPLRKSVRPNRETKQVDDEYEFTSVFDIRFFPRFKYYKYFDSYEIDDRPPIKAELYHHRK